MGGDTQAAAACLEAEASARGWWAAADRLAWEAGRGVRGAGDAGGEEARAGGADEVDGDNAESRHAAAGGRASRQGTAPDASRASSAWRVAPEEVPAGALQAPRARGLPAACDARGPRRGGVVAKGRGAGGGPGEDGRGGGGGGYAGAEGGEAVLAGSGAEGGGECVRDRVVGPCECRAAAAAGGGAMRGSGPDPGPRRSLRVER